MALVLARDGEVVWLNYLLETHTDRNLVLHLYDTDKTPAETDSAATFNAIEVSGGSYNEITLTRNSWTVNEGDADDNSYATYAQQEFAFTADVGLVYGYYVTEATSDTLLWPEKFDNPEDTYSGKSIFITPRLELN